jgi:hypothetical protein
MHYCVFDFETFCRHTNEQKDYFKNKINRKYFQYKNSNKTLNLQFFHQILSENY